MMHLRKKGLASVALAFSMAICPLAYATTPQNGSLQPLAINYTLEQVEDKLEKELDKQFKVNWDFEIVYHDDKIFLEIEYDTKSAKAFSKISSENLQQFVSDIIKRISTALKRDIEVTGMIIADDAQKPTYTFTYKDGRLDMK